MVYFEKLWMHFLDIMLCGRFSLFTNMDGCSIVGSQKWPYPVTQLELDIKLCSSQ